MRTYKIGTILLFQADASDKEEDPGQGQERRGREEDEGCTRKKCRVWFILSQEMTAIGCVAFLLLVCLPVLAFWFMFIGIFISAYNIYSLLKRLWKEAHSRVNNNSDRVEAEEDGGDVEFQEFLTHFSDEIEEFD